MSSDRHKIAYNTFRSGFGNACPVPAWDDAPPWLRDVILVAYLQGAVDAPYNWPRWIADLNTMELTERQSDNSYRVAYKMMRATGR
jgi:hypothetical protein